MYMKPGRLFSKQPQNLKGYEALADLQAPAPQAASSTSGISQGSTCIWIFFRNRLKIDFL